MKKKLLPILISVIVIFLLLGVYFLLKDRSGNSGGDDSSGTASSGTEYLIKDDSTKVDQFSYTKDGKELSFVYSEDKGWKYEKDTSLVLNSDQVQDSLKYLWEVSVKRTLTDVAESDLSGFGLDHPAEVIKYTLQGGKQVSLSIGAENTTITAYYAYLNDDPSTVYLISAGIENVYRHPLEDYLSDSGSS